MTDMSSRPGRGSGWMVDSISAAVPECTPCSGSSSPASCPGGPTLNGPQEVSRPPGKLLSQSRVPVEPAHRRADAFVGEEREAVLMEECLVDVEAAVDEHAVSQASAGVEAERPHAAARRRRSAAYDSIAADLGGVDEFAGVQSGPAVRQPCVLRRLWSA